MRNISIPLLSIITVVYNAENFIETTLKSVKKQKTNWIEYLVIDGNSKDNTCTILEEYHEIIDMLISENDLGIYDAMNKGILASKGEYISFLNAGDLLVPNFIEIIEEELSLNNDLICFGINLKFSNDKQLLVLPTKFDKLNFNPQHMYLPHPGLISKKSIFDEFGLFNIEYKYSGDLDWVNRAILSPIIKIKYVQKPLVIYLAGGVSASVKAYRETKNIAIRYEKSKFVSNWIFFKQILKLYIIAISKKSIK